MFGGRTHTPKILWHAPRAGVYAFNISVKGGNSCIASFNVTGRDSTVTCAPARLVALPQANSCTDVALALSSLYNVSTPSGPSPVVTVSPSLPSPLSFAPGEPGPRAYPKGVPQTAGRAVAWHHPTEKLAHSAKPLQPRIEAMARAGSKPHAQVHFACEC